MDDNFTMNYIENEYKIRKKYEGEHPLSYGEIACDVVAILGADRQGFDPNPHKVTLINNGPDEKLVLFVIACKGDNPQRYWRMMISTDEEKDKVFANAHSKKTPTEEQINRYMDVAFSLFQTVGCITDGVY
ncbi:MAG: hypothetical protein EOM67_11735 [Spirochaetia bacterium]|nr:hypothetical protein [Spirochaetia bacterium]